MKTYNEYQKGEKKAIFNAVWQYILDHSEIENSGVLFVKFHCKDKATFARRIQSRMKGSYRNGAWFQRLIDIRREQVGEEAKKQSEKAIKNNILSREKQIEALAKLKNQQPKRIWWRRWF